MWLVKLDLKKFVFFFPTLVVGFLRFVEACPPFVEFVSIFYGDSNVKICALWIVDFTTCWHFAFVVVKCASVILPGMYYGVIKVFDSGVFSQ